MVRMLTRASTVATTINPQTRRRRRRLEATALELTSTSTCRACTAVMFGVDAHARTDPPHHPIGRNGENGLDTCSGSRHHRGNAGPSRDRTQDEEFPAYGLDTVAEPLEAGSVALDGAARSVVRDVEVQQPMGKPETYEDGGCVRV